MALLQMLHSMGQKQTQAPREKKMFDFDKWWESQFGFQKFGQPLYPFLKAIHAVGGHPRYVYALALFHSDIKRTITRAVQESRAEKKPKPRRTAEGYEAALKQFGWRVFIETLHRLDEIQRTLKTPSSIFPQELLDALKIGEQIMLESIDKHWHELGEHYNRETERAVKEHEKMIADMKQKSLVGEIFYKYGVTPLKRKRGNQSELWDTFCLTALSEHLQKTTNQPHYALGAWMLDTRPPSNARKATKNVGERVRQFKQQNPSWMLDVAKLKRALTPPRQSKRNTN